MVGCSIAAWSLSLPNPSLSSTMVILLTHPPQKGFWAGWEEVDLVLLWENLHNWEDESVCARGKVQCLVSFWRYACNVLCLLRIYSYLLVQKYKHVLDGTCERTSCLDITPSYLATATTDRQEPLSMRCPKYDLVNLFLWNLTACNFKEPSSW